MKTANIPTGNFIPKNIILNTDNDIVEVLDSIVIYEHLCEEDGHKRILTLNLVGDTPAHLKGWELVQKRDLMTIGISIGNGYFNKWRLKVILTGMASYFSELVVIIPDVSALHSYRALGYAEHLAVRKVREHKNKIIDCCESIFSEARKSLGHDIKSRIVTWHDDFTRQEYYQQAYKRAIETYRSDSKFRESIQRNTEHYILARLEEQDLRQLGGMKAIIEKAAYYLIEEMAFHEVFHIVLGKEPIASYYKELELATNYVNGNYGNPQNKHFGWIVYNLIESE